MPRPDQVDRTRLEAKAGVRHSLQGSGQPDHAPGGASRHSQTVDQKRHHRPITEIIVGAAPVQLGDEGDAFSLKRGGEPPTLDKALDEILRKHRKIVDIENRPVQKSHHCNKVRPGYDTTEAPGARLQTPEPPGVIAGPDDVAMSPAASGKGSSPTKLSPALQRRTQRCSRCHDVGSCYEPSLTSKISSATRPWASRCTV